MSDELNEGLFLCLDCGERKRFFKEYWRNAYADIIDEVDASDSYIDNYSYDTSEDETSADQDISYNCRECDSLNVIRLPENERIQRIWKHTDKQGEWHIKELPKNKRDANILKVYLLNKI